MAKLYFMYGAMGCGKSISLMQMAHNYEAYGKKILVIKPEVDKKGGKKLVSRIGLEREVDIVLPADESVYNYDIDFDSLDCILVDEAQFLATKQATELWIISKQKDVPVMCYGLRSDFRNDFFIGSKRLMEIADEMKELIMICHCGNMAKFNARKVNGEFVSDGDQVAIDGFDNVTYEALCGDCYLEKVMKISSTNHKKVLKR